MKRVYIFIRGRVILTLEKEGLTFHMLGFFHRLFFIPIYNKKMFVVFLMVFH